MKRPLKTIINPGSNPPFLLSRPIRSAIHAYRGVGVLPYEMAFTVHGPAVPAAATPRGRPRGPILDHFGNKALNFVRVLDLCVLLAAPAGQCTLKATKETSAFSRYLAWLLFRGVKQEERRKKKAETSEPKTPPNEHANNTEQTSKQRPQIIINGSSESVFVGPGAS